MFTPPSGAAFASDAPKGLGCGVGAPAKRGGSRRRRETPPTASDARRRRTLRLKNKGGSNNQNRGAKGKQANGIGKGTLPSRRHGHAPSVFEARGRRQRREARPRRFGLRPDLSDRCRLEMAREEKDVETIAPPVVAAARPPQRGPLVVQRRRRSRDRASRPFMMRRLDGDVVAPGADNEAVGHRPDLEQAQDQQPQQQRKTSFSRVHGANDA